MGAEFRPGHGGLAHCPPCLETLRELCHLGRGLSDPGRRADLCRAYEGYLATADDRFVDMAAAAAPPELLAQARARLVASGRLPRWA